jgi:large subunit ribosomal protein L4e
MIIKDLEGIKVKEIKVPEQFHESYHPNLIKRAALTIRANKRQPYGAFSEAGKRASVKISKRRHNYRGCYGRGVSRIPRKVVWRRGTQFGFTAAFAPGTVSGRKAHPPKSQKKWNKKLNTKENRKAIRSALSATLNLELIKKRSHIPPKDYPFIIESKIESIQKTKEVKKILEKLGLKEELKRISVKKLRAGKGKSRGRKYKKKIGPLIVVSSNCKLIKSSMNIPGIDIIEINKLNAEILAPGAQAGRLTLFTEEAIERLEKEKLFTNHLIKKKVKE